MYPWQRTNTHGGRRITPKKQREQQDLIRWCWLELPASMRSEWPLDACYRLSADFFLPDRKTRDLSNLVKQVEDALEGHAWDNDRRIWEYGHVRRWISDNPRTVVQIETVKERLE